MPRHDFQIQDLVVEGRIAESDINELKSWLESTDFPDITDQQVALFLLSCNNNQENTRKTIKSYYNCKANAPELFDNWFLGDKSVEYGFKNIESAVLPKRTENNCSVTITRLKDKNYWNFNLESCIKVLFMCLEFPLYSNPPRGLIVILDMKGFSLLHLTKFRVGLLRKFFSYLQEGLPCQLEQIHILNVVSFFDKVMAIMRPFMKKELYEMIKLHNSNDIDEFMRRWIPKEGMPSDYGGDLPDLEILTLTTMDMLRNLEQSFYNEEQQRKNSKKST